MDKLNKQAMVNQVWHYFLVEGHTAGITESGSCRYAGPCALGIFITPEQRDHFDQDEVQASDFPAALPELIDESVSPAFLEMLQEAHDRSAKPGGAYEQTLPNTPEVFHDNLRAALTSLAGSFNLEVPRE